MTWNAKPLDIERVFVSSVMVPFYSMRHVIAFLASLWLDDLPGPNSVRKSVIGESFRSSLWIVAKIELIGFLMRLALGVFLAFPVNEPIRIGSVIIVTALLAFVAMTQIAALLLVEVVDRFINLADCAFSMSTPNRFRIGGPHGIGNTGHSAFLLGLHYPISQGSVKRVVGRPVV